MAVKVSPHVHEPERVCVEDDRNSEKDTGRFLQAGAQRAVLITGELEVYGESLVNDSRTASDGLSLLIESNRAEFGSIVRAGKSSVSLAVLAGRVEDWKDSVWRLVRSVDAMVLTGGFCVNDLPGGLREKRIFVLSAGSWSSLELVQFVRGRLGVG